LAKDSHAITHLGHACPSRAAPIDADNAIETNAHTAEDAPGPALAGEAKIENAHRCQRRRDGLAFERRDRHALKVNIDGLGGRTDTRQVQTILSGNCVLHVGILFRRELPSIARRRRT
jgi:hypothetical protein